jgi:hypothetical protein
MNGKQKTAQFFENRFFVTDLTNSPKKTLTSIVFLEQQDFWFETTKELQE